MPTTKDGRTLEAARDDDQQRYVATVDGALAGLIEFMQAPDVVVLTHTEVTPDFEGQGVASALVRWVLDDIRSHGYLVRPVCPFVAAFIDKHPDEYADLVHHSPDAAR